MDALAMLTEQLWGPGSSGDVRVVTASSVSDDLSPQWRTVEEYWVLPHANDPRLLIPRADGTVQHAALTHYSGLRRTGANVARRVAGTVARTGAPLSATRLQVQVREPAPGQESSDAAAGLPLARMAEALGLPTLYATFGVRTGANRKATLHLISPEGDSVGYAKLGWNTTADEYVRTEGATLAAVGGRPEAMRAPALLAQFEHGGRPVIITAPLPADVRGVRGTVRGPDARELHALAPVVDVRPAGTTRHLKALRTRLEAMPEVAESDDLLTAAFALLERVEQDPREVPVQARWHGDLTPWNCARESSGQLWVWDWESSEEDVVAGLDALHWEFSVEREAGRLATLTLADCMDRARHLVHATGTPASAHGLVVAVYTLTVVERAVTLAAREGGWERVWITPTRIRKLLDEAASLLS